MCSGNNTKEIGSRNGNTITMIDTSFQIRDELFINNASEEYNGTYICKSEGRILVKIYFEVRLTGKGFI